MTATPCLPQPWQLRRGARPPPGVARPTRGDPLGGPNACSDPTTNGCSRQGDFPNRCLPRTPDRVTVRLDASDGVHVRAEPAKRAKEIDAIQPERGRGGHED